MGPTFEGFGTTPYNTTAAERLKSRIENTLEKREKTIYKPEIAEYIGNMSEEEILSCVANPEELYEELHKNGKLDLAPYILDMVSSTPVCKAEEKATQESFRILISLSENQTDRSDNIHIVSALFQLLNQSQELQKLVKTLNARAKQQIAYKNALERDLTKIQ